MTNLTITSANAQEHEVHRFSADASELGLPPGSWPKAIATTLGNGLNFVFAGADREGGELRSVTYRQVAGCIELEIFND